MGGERVRRALRSLSGAVDATNRLPWLVVRRGYADVGRRRACILWSLTCGLVRFSGWEPVAALAGAGVRRLLFDLSDPDAGACFSERGSGRPGMTMRARQEFRSRGVEAIRLARQARFMRQFDRTGCAGNLWQEHDSARLFYYLSGMIPICSYGPQGNGAGHAWLRGRQTIVTFLLRRKGALVLSPVQPNMISAARSHRSGLAAAMAPVPSMPIR